MDPGPMSPMELEALKAATEPTPPPATEPAAPVVRAHPIEKCLKCDGPKMNHMSDLCDACEGKPAAPAAEALVETPANDVPEEDQFSPEPGYVHAMRARISQLEDERNSAERDAATNRSALAEATNKISSHRRALKEAEAEFRQAGVHVDDSSLQNFPGQLGNFVRRLAREVKQVGPDRDALRAEVRRLNGEILEHPKQLAAKDEDISKLRNDVDAGKQREKALERTAEQMQTARDSALQQLKTQQSFSLEAARANDELRAKAEDLEGRLQALASWTVWKGPKLVIEKGEEMRVVVNAKGEISIGLRPVQAAAKP